MDLEMVVEDDCDGDCAEFVQCDQCDWERDQAKLKQLRQEQEALMAACDGEDPEPDSEDEEATNTQENQQNDDKTK